MLRADPRQLGTRDPLHQCDGADRRSKIRSRCPSPAHPFTSSFKPLPTPEASVTTALREIDGDECVNRQIIGHKVRLMPYNYQWRGVPYLKRGSRTDVPLSRQNNALFCFYSHGLLPLDLAMASYEFGMREFVPSAP